MAVNNTSSYRQDKEDKYMKQDEKGRFVKGYTHKRFYPKTPEAWINWYVGESENRTIQSMIRSDAKSKIHIKQKPSTCMCHINKYISRNERTIFNNISKRAKTQWRSIINQLDLQQKTRHRIKNRIYNNNKPEGRGIYNEKAYQKQKNAQKKLEVLTVISGGKPSCNCCGVDVLDMLAIDHINNNGAAHRKALKKRGHSPNIYLQLDRWIKEKRELVGYQIL